LSLRKLSASLFLLSDVAGAGLAVRTFCPSEHTPNFSPKLEARTFFCLFNLSNTEAKFLCLDQSQNTSTWIVIRYLSGDKNACVLKSSFSGNLML